MSAGLPIKESVDASNAVFSSRTPSDAELSFDDKRRSSPTKRTNNGDHAQGLLQSEYRNATEMACSSTLQNGGVEDDDVDNTGDWKNTLGGNPKRFHPIWGPPIPRKGMTMTIGNGGKSEKIEWDPFFGPPVVKSRGVPKLTKAVEDGGDLTRVGLMANYHWEGLENGPISSPALQVPRPQQYQIGAPPGGGMMNPHQHQQQLQHQQQQIQMMIHQFQQQQANGQPVTPQQQQQLMMMQQQHQMTINGGQHQQQQHPQFQQQGGQPMNPQQQQLMMQQMQMQQQQTGGQPFTPQQQQMLIQQRMQMQQQQQQGMQQQQQQPNNGNNLANQQQQQYPTYTQQQQQPAPTPVVEQQREPYSAPLSAQSSLGIELDTVAGGGGGGDGHSSAVSSSLDVDGVTARRVGTSPPAHNHNVDDDDL